MLRKLLSSVLALALIAGLPAAAQLLEGEEPVEQLPLLPLEQILDNYYDAIGGEEAWLAVRSLKMTGRMMMGPGMEVPVSVFVQRPDKQRVEFTFQGMTGIQAIDGEQAWEVMPFLGKMEPATMPAEQADQMRDHLDIEGPLVGWASKGHLLELLGPGSAQGTDAYLIKVTLVSGKEQTYYLDGDSFVPFLMESTSTLQGVEVEIETVFSDYKDVGDLVVPHSIEIRPKGQPGGQTIIVETVEPGADVSGVQFSLPVTTSQ